jgi:hypothetical protein
LGLPPAFDALPFADRMADVMFLLDLAGLEEFADRASLRAVTLAGFGFRTGVRFFFAAGAFRAATFLGVVFFAGFLEEADFFAIFLGADFLVERAINVIGGASFLSRPE